MTNQALRVLVVYWSADAPHQMRSAVQHHLRALEHATVPPHVTYHNAFCDLPSVWGGGRFDAVLLHTTALCLRWFSDFHRVWYKRLRWIGRLNCVKVAIPQDEYDHAEILDGWLDEWGIDLVMTNFDDRLCRKLYPRLHRRAVFVPCLTGYLDPRAMPNANQLLPLRDRPLDIVYRATRLPYWFGSHGQLKHRVGEVVARRAAELGFKTDISTRREDAVLGTKWLSFLSSARITLGCESGSSVLDSTGAIQREIQRLLGQKPDLSFEEINRMMPVGWDDHKFFAIGPRHLEAVATKTCQVLVEGTYNGILQPHRHYLPLKSDWSNLDEVLEACNDLDAMQAMVDRAYEDIYLSGACSSRVFADLLLQVLEAQVNTRSRNPTAGPTGLNLTARAEDWMVAQRVRASNWARRVKRLMRPLA